MILDRWREMSGRFVKVMPIDYRKALVRLREREQVKSEARPRPKKSFAKGININDRTDPTDSQVRSHCERSTRPDPQNRSMGNPTGFKQFTRIGDPAPSGFGTDQGLVRNRPAADRQGAQRAGGPLHGLRHSRFATAPAAR